MRLAPLPAEFAVTRDALHQIAFFALAPARYRAVGLMGLRPTPGGFGTPEFDGKVARVEGDLLVHEEHDNIATRTITTLRDAASFFGLEYEVGWFEDLQDPLHPVDPDRALAVDLESAGALARWFAFGFEVLEGLRSRGVAGDDPSEVELWPEHFDAALMGSEQEGLRASYGASPGDKEHPQPYLYVSAWEEIDRSDPYWNDEAFNGASLAYDELVGADDPAGRAIEFLLVGYRAIRGGG